MRKRWRLWLGLLISGGLLAVVLRGQRLPEVWAALREADYVWLFPGIAIYFLAVWARAWRWHYLLRPLEPVASRELFPIVCIGYMGNNIYPARAGEILRSYVLRRRTGISMSASLATIVVERIFDGLVMLLFVFVTLPLAGLGARYQSFVVFFSILFFGALALFLVLAVHTERVERIYDGVVHARLPQRVRVPIQQGLNRFLTGLHSLRSRREMAMLFATSVVIWLFETGKYWFVMHAFPFRVNFYVLMLMNGVVNLFTTLPAAPGYIGTFDAPGIQILQNFGVPAEVATAYTAVLHAALWFPITALGAFYLWRERLSWERVQVEVEVEEEPTGLAA